MILHQRGHLLFDLQYKSFSYNTGEIWAPRAKQNRFKNRTESLSWNRITSNEIKSLPTEQNYFERKKIVLNGTESLPMEQNRFERKGIALNGTELLRTDEESDERQQIRSTAIYMHPYAVRLRFPHRSFGIPFTIAITVTEPAYSKTTAATRFVRFANLPRDRFSHI